MTRGLAGGCLGWPGPAILGSMPPDSAISSRHNPRFRAALALREARERRTSGRILVDGAREIVRAVSAGVQVLEAFVAPGFVERAGLEAKTAREAVRAAGGEMVEVSAELLGRLAYGDRDDGLVLVATMPSTALAELAVPDAPLIAVLDGIEKPGNLGAILRSADGAGVDAVLVTDPRTDPWNPNCIRASLGTVFSLPLAVASAAEARGWLSERGARAVAARVDAGLSYTDADLRGAVAIVLGSEAEGLSDAWRGDDVRDVRIPMLGVADSLNVSVSAAILFYEALRQRGAAGR